MPKQAASATSPAPQVPINSDSQQTTEAGSINQSSGSDNLWTTPRTLEPKQGLQAKSTVEHALNIHDPNSFKIAPARVTSPLKKKPKKSRPKRPVLSSA